MKNKNPYSSWTKHIVIFLATIFVVAQINGVSITIAQEELPDPLILPSGMVDQAWSIDSQTFVFKTSQDSTGLETSEVSWYEYDVETQLVNRYNSWPLQPLLIPQDFATYEIERLSSGRARYTFVSPNNRYLAYHHISEDDYGFQMLAIADLSTNQYVTTNISLFGSTPSNLIVKWSEDSSALTVWMTTPYGGINTYYISNFQEDVSSLTVFELLSGLIVNGESYSIFDVFDISSDGNTVLLLGATDVTNTRLIIWKPLTPEQSRVIDIENTTTLDAAFSPSDENEVLMVNQSGIVSHNTITNETTLLRADVNTTSFQQAMFSPDGEWIAVASYRASGSGDLYIVEVIDSGLACDPAFTIADGDTATLISAITAANTHSYAYTYLYHRNSGSKQKRLLAPGTCTHRAI